MKRYRVSWKSKSSKPIVVAAADPYSARKLAVRLRQSQSTLSPERSSYSAKEISNVEDMDG